MREFAPTALQCLTQFDWPGNVRELRSAVEHAVVFASGEQKQIEHDDLPYELQKLLPAGDSSKELESPLSIEQNVKRLILRALEQTNGNKTEAARLLGISRRTLLRKIAQWEINH